MVKNALLILLFISSSYAISSAQTCTPQRYINNIYTAQVTQEPALYGVATDWTGGSQNLSFDFYEPAGDVLTKRPLIIMSFGGSFLGGSKRQAELVDFCNRLAEKGFCVASIDYRLGFNLFSTDSAVRAVYRGMQDFKAAVRYFRANAAMYNIDPNHIFGGGNSAGSINAIHAAYADESDRTMSNILAATFNNPDLGCLNCSGNTLTTSSKLNGVVNLWGGIGDVNWINTGEAPIISFHAADDTTVSPYTASPYGFPIFPPLSGSVPIHAQTSTVGIVNDLHLYATGGHEMWGNATTALLIQDSSAIFLNQLMMPPTPTITGNLNPCNGSISDYCIPSPTIDSDYCWSVTGGTIISNNNTCISIQWNNPPVTGTVTVIEKNCLHALSNPATINVNISNSPAPVANFNFTYNANGGIDFTNTSTGGTNYTWDFGDGNTSTTANPSHAYTTNGNYLVTLTVTSANGCTSTFIVPVHQYCQATLTIPTNNTPSATYTAFNWIYSDKTVAMGSTVTFNAGDCIILDTGFEANGVNTFIAETIPCQN